MEIQVEYVDIDELKPFVGNPREHSERNIEDITRSIKRFGWTNPILVRREDNMVIAGHGRLEAARHNGLSQVPVIYLDMSENDARLYAITDNRTAETAAWDLTALSDLAQELDRMPEIDLRDTGFMLDELDDLFAPLDMDWRDEDFDTNEAMQEAEPITKPGDIWLCGRHRILCGDSTKQDDVERLMAGKRAALMVTDPPYGVSYADKNTFLNAIDKGNRIQTSIEHDDMPPEEMENLWTAAFALAFKYCLDGACYYVFSPQGADMLMMMLSTKASGWLLRQTIIWVKNNHVLGRSDYNYKHEPIFYGWRGSGHAFYGGGGETTVWEADKPQASDLHPTMKPVELIARAIRNSSRRGEIVLDPFLGSGTTLIAAEKLGRICYGMEIEPRYVDVICRRYAEFTGNAPVLEETGESFPNMDITEGVIDGSTG